MRPWGYITFFFRMGKKTLLGRWTFTTWSIMGNFNRSDGQFNKFILVVKQFVCLLKLLSKHTSKVLFWWYLQKKELCNRILNLMDGLRTIFYFLKLFACATPVEVIECMCHSSSSQWKYVLNKLVLKKDLGFQIFIC